GRKRAFLHTRADASEETERHRDDDGAEQDCGHERPDDLQRGVEDGQSDDAEKDDTGQAPLARRNPRSSVVDFRLAHPRYTAIKPRRAASTTASVRVTAPSLPR